MCAVPRKKFNATPRQLVECARFCGRGTGKRSHCSFSCVRSLFILVWDQDAPLPESSGGAAAHVHAHPGRPHRPRGGSIVDAIQEAEKKTKNRTYPASKAQDGHRRGIAERGIATGRAHEYLRAVVAPREFAFGVNLRNAPVSKAIPPMRRGENSTSCTFLRTFQTSIVRFRRQRGENGPATTGMICGYEGWSEKEILKGCRRRTGAASGYEDPPSPGSATKGGASCALVPARYNTREENEDGSKTYQWGMRCSRGRSVALCRIGMRSGWRADLYAGVSNGSKTARAMVIGQRPRKEAIDPTAHCLHKLVVWRTGPWEARRVTSPRTVAGMPHGVGWCMRARVAVEKYCRGVGLAVGTNDEEGG
ncbi:hypothetical protein B0H16DRAFT_1455067 [Mycena metata]|uniref:Uncharacterized protein n=1 Tax=Mycena metata TaxID=1033252 RepID=A0AAD7NK68_9AGAR|nr:hypothetical protein B0H16DRAFT_1455067 [Mycena metata]